MYHRYESDLDREEAEEREKELEEQRAHEEELKRYPERRTFFDAERSESLTANWLQENKWMDEYRKVVMPSPLSSPISFSSVCSFVQESRRGCLCQFCPESSHCAE